MQKIISTPVGIIIIVAVALVVFGGIFVYQYYFIPQQELIIINHNNNQQIVGGDRDEHGCIGSAGYTWCETKEKCLRQWEENCDLTSAEALEILKTDKKCGNPERVEKFIPNDFEQREYRIPKGKYWKSSIFYSSRSGPGPSNGCWSECYLDVTNKNKIYYNSGCI